MFTDKLTPYVLIAGLITFFCYVFVPDDQIDTSIPLKCFAKIAVCDLIVHVCLITAMLRTNYTTMIVVNTTSLLSVVVVGAFCSGVNHQSNPDAPSRRSNKVGPEKIWICAIICVGVAIFALSAPPKEGAALESEAAEIGGTLLTALLFVVAIVLQGFRPDFAAQLKQEHDPHPLFFAMGTAGCVFVIGLVVSVCSLQAMDFVIFVYHHERFIVDLAVMAVLMATAAIFAFRIVANFRQHIYPLVCKVRNYITVCFNVFWFGHHLATLQWVGIGVICLGIAVEIINNYNLADRILPNEDVSYREGKPYNKLSSPDADPPSAKKTTYDPIAVGDDLEGI